MSPLRLGLQDLSISRVLASWLVLSEACGIHLAMGQMATGYPKNPGLVKGKIDPSTDLVPRGGIFLTQSHSSLLSFGVATLPILLAVWNYLKIRLNLFIRFFNGRPVFTQVDASRTADVLHLSPQKASRRCFWTPKKLALQSLKVTTQWTDVDTLGSTFSGTCWSTRGEIVVWKVTSSWHRVWVESPAKDDVSYTQSFSSHARVIYLIRTSFFSHFLWEVGWNRVKIEGSSFGIPSYSSVSSKVPYNTLPEFSQNPP